jgi:hypothetical protein
MHIVIVLDLRNFLDLGIMYSELYCFKSSTTTTAMQLHNLFSEVIWFNSFLNSTLNSNNH